MRRTAFSILAALVAVVALVPANAESSARPKIHVAGLPDRCDDGTYVVRVAFDHPSLSPGVRRRLRVRLDGSTVVSRAARRAHFELDCSTLPYGEHELEVSASVLDAGRTAKRVRFVVAEPEV